MFNCIARHETDCPLMDSTAQEANSRFLQIYYTPSEIFDYCGINPGHLYGRNPYMKIVNIIGNEILKLNIDPILCHHVKSDDHLILRNLENEDDDYVQKLVCNLLCQLLSFILKQNDFYYEEPDVVIIEPEDFDYVYTIGEEYDEIYDIEVTMGKLWDNEKIKVTLNYYEYHSICRQDLVNTMSYYFLKLVGELYLDSESIEANKKLNRSNWIGKGSYYPWTTSYNFGRIIKIKLDLRSEILFNNSEFRLHPLTMNCGGVLG